MHTSAWIEEKQPNLKSRMNKKKSSTLSKDLNVTLVIRYNQKSASPLTQTFFFTHNTSILCPFFSKY